MARWLGGALAAALAASGALSSLTGLKPLSPAAMKSVLKIAVRFGVWIAPRAILGSWLITLLAVVPLRGNHLLSTTKARSRLTRFGTILVVATVAHAAATRQYHQRLMIAVLLTFAGAALALGTRVASESSTSHGKPIDVWKGLLRKLGEGIYRVGAWLGVTNGGNPIAKLIAGGCVLTIVLVMSCIPVAALVEASQRVVSRVHDKQHEQPTPPVGALVFVARPPIPAGPYHCADYDWAEGAPARLAAAMQRAGEEAAIDFDACPISPTHPLVVGQLYEQYAFTRDSNRSRVVGWVDAHDEVHATFVTSDEANGYIRYSVALDWAAIGMPLQMTACAGRFVQPFVDFDGQLRGVGVAGTRDVLGQANEAIYVPEELLESWLSVSESVGLPALPAGQAGPSQFGIQQFVRDQRMPLLASNSLPDDAFGRLEALCPAVTQAAVPSP